MGGGASREDATNIGFGIYGPRSAAIDVEYGAAGCMTQIDREIWEVSRMGTRTVSDQTTRHVCGEGGRRVLRETTDNLTGQTQRVIDFAGLAEIRPDDGIMLWRVPVNGAVTVEEARSLATGERDVTQSGYIHTDLRGSTLARTGWNAQMSLPFEEAEYGPWGETLRVSANNGPPTHQFVGFEPDPATGWYFMGARVYDPTLRRWLSPDPLMLAAPEMDSAKGIELNLYSYTGNNPIIYTDPDGTCRLNGDKVDCFSAAWESYKAITAATTQSLREGNYGDAAVGTVLGTAQTVNVGAGYVTQGFADVWNAVIDAKEGDYTSLAVAAVTAAIPLRVGRGRFIGTLGKQRN